MKQLSPTDYRALVEQGERYTLIDVREPEEFAFCQLAGAELLPLSEISRWEAELAEREETLVIYCHHGVRSARVCARLAALGHSDAINLAGGIDRWSIEVDSGIPRY